MEAFLRDIGEIIRNPYIALIFFAALAFDFINGFHDAANSIATVVGTRVLRPFQAVCWAAWWNFAAAWFFGVHVANAVAKWVHVEYITIDVIFAGLLGASSLGMWACPRVRRTLCSADSAGRPSFTPARRKACSTLPK